MLHSKTYISLIEVKKHKCVKKKNIYTSVNHILKSSNTLQLVIASCDFFNVKMKKILQLYVKINK